MAMTMKLSDVVAKHDGHDNARSPGAELKKIKPLASLDEQRLRYDTFDMQHPVT